MLHNSGLLESEKSRTVQVNSLQALADLARDDTKLVPKVAGIIKGFVKDGSPAVVSRGGNS